MFLKKEEKEELKQQIRTFCTRNSAIEKVIIFGSFIHSLTPHDIDLAIISNSSADYLTQAMEYRRLLRPISQIIPIDIIPIKKEAFNNEGFISEIRRGELIYEKRNRIMG